MKILDQDPHTENEDLMWVLVRKDDLPAPIYDPDGGVFYEPFIASDGRVGYRVGRTDDRPDAETFIYLNPSFSGGGDDTPNVFLYIGVENDPNEDEPQHFYTLDREDFGIEED